MLKISIWIVSEDVPKGLQNTITAYEMTPRHIVGNADIPREYYDKMETVIIRRGKNGNLIAPVFEYLDAVFSSDIETMDKFTPASANWEIAKEVADMPGMSQAILERGFIQGREQGREQRDREKIEAMLRKGKDPEAIADFCDYPLSLVKEVEKSILSMA